MTPSPDPQPAANAEEFIALLNRLRHWADISYRELERRAAKAGDALPRTTVAGVLSRKDLPRADFLAAYLRACGLDQTTAQTWLDTRHRLAAALAPPASTPADETTPIPVPHTPSPAPLRPSGRRMLATTLLAAATAAVTAIIATTLWLGAPAESEPLPAAQPTTQPKPQVPTPTPTPTSTAPTSPPPAQDGPATTRPSSSPDSGLPPAGPAAIQPVSNTALCLTEGFQRNGRNGREIAVQGPCSPVPQVILETVGHDVYRIRWEHPKNGTGCLTPTSHDDGALIGPNDCTSSNDQKIRLEPFHDGYRLRPITTDYCLGFLPPVTEGAEAIQAPCTGSSQQVFRITKP